MKPMTESIKREHLSRLAAFRKQLYEEPRLRYLFLELTLRCNERCLHCGSSCGGSASPEMSLSDYERVLTEVKEDFDIGRIQLCITGGEPLLRRDFFEIMSMAHEMGYHWGMTTNATLIDRPAAKKLKECGMDTVSVSIDGLKESHDAFRQTPGAYDRAMRGLNCLIEEGGFKEIQVTTVVNHQTIRELPELYKIMLDLDIDSWRVIGMEPIGRALSHPELLLTDADQRILFDFIREKRAEDMPVTYGCSHYLGPELEGELRDFYFICCAGIYTASIMADGGIGACLDIERRPETIRGNIYNDRFSEVWKNRFRFFRRDFSGLNAECASCSEREFCAGGSKHSWDYDRNRQRVCFFRSPARGK